MIKAARQNEPLLLFFAVSAASAAIRTTDTFFTAFFSLMDVPHRQTQNRNDHNDHQKIYKSHGITSFQQGLSQA